MSEPRTIQTAKLPPAERVEMFLDDMRKSAAAKRELAWRRRDVSLLMDAAVMDSQVLNLAAAIDELIEDAK